MRLDHYKNVGACCNVPHGATEDTEMVLSRYPLRTK